MLPTSLFKCVTELFFVLLWIEFRKNDEICFHCYCSLRCFRSKADLAYTII